MVNTVADFTELKTPREQFDALHELSRHVPTAVPGIDMDERTIAALPPLLDGPPAGRAATCQGYR